MRRSTLTLLALIAVFAISACRSNAEDCIDAATDQQKQLQANSQEQAKKSMHPGIAVREGGSGDNIAAPSETSATFQRENQNNAPQVHFASLMQAQKDAACILTNTTPGEQWVIHELADIRKERGELKRQLINTPSAEAGEIARLREELGANKREADSLVKRLEGYAASKLSQARTVMPAFESLTHFVQVVFNDQLIGLDPKRKLSEDQQAALKEIVMGAIGRQEKLATNQRRSTPAKPPAPRPPAPAPASAPATGGGP